MVWLITLCSTALACAGLIHDEGSVAESDAAEVLLEAQGDQTQITYAVTYSGDAEAFGWIIPVPGDVLAVDDGDVAVFDGLREVSQPGLVILEPYEEGSAGCSCAGAAKGGDNELGTGGEGNQVGVVLAEGFTGTYDYVVLDASDAQELQAWLEAEGWSQGELQNDIAYYTGGGGTFVALRLSQSEPVSGQQLPPLTITAATTELSFPSVMARHAPIPQRTTVYVAGQERAEVTAGWSFDDRDEVYGPADADPLEVFEGELAEMGAEGAWLRTWSGEHDGRFVTRFDLLADPEQHVADAVFGFDGTTYDASTVVWLEGSSSQALLWVGLLGMGGLARRRSRGHRRALASAT